MQATMLPVGKPLCQEFEITQFRDLSGKDWMECNLLWTSSIASNTLRFHSVWISRWCLQCRGTLAPTNRIFGMTAPGTSEFFCNVRSVISLSNATRLMSQRPQREKLPASPDPLRCDVHVIKRVVWQFCNPQHTSSILEAVTVAQQNYHAIWECCSQSGNCLPQFRHDSVTHWTKGSFGQSDCVTNLIDQNSICALNPRMWDDLNSNP